MEIEDQEQKQEQSTEVTLENRMESERNLDDHKDEQLLAYEGVLSDAFREVKIFVEAGKREAFVQLKKPQLHKFLLPSEEKDLDDCQRAEPQDIQRWGKDEVLEVDLTVSGDTQQFGEIQRDPQTGEQFILLPIDIEYLIDSDSMTPDTATEYLNSYDRFKEVMLAQAGDVGGHTIHLQRHEKEEQEQQQKVQPGGESGDQLNWEYHMHQFKVPKLSFPFELNFGPDPNPDAASGPGPGPGSEGVATGPEMAKGSPEQELSPRAAPKQRMSH